MESVAVNCFREQRQSSCKHHQASVFGSNSPDSVQTSELLVILASGKCHGIINSCLLWVAELMQGPRCHVAGGIASGAWLSPLYPCLCLLERKGSIKSINVNRTHVELDVSEHPVATSESQAPSREFSRAKSQLASYPWLGSTAWVGVFRSQFLVTVPVLKSCSSHGLCSARDTSWVFSLTRKKFSHYLTEVCLSIHSQFSESPESLGSW